MFTGIVEEVGEIISRSGNRVYVKGSLEDSIGASIAVNGACLTLLEKSRGVLTFEVSEETLRRTNLSASRYVNLERSLIFGSKVSGHIVLGHVDCVSNIISVDGKSMEVELPAKYAKYVIEKGSVAIDGISLTIAEVREHSFAAALLPYTIESTNLRYGQKRVNLEFDYIVKAVQAGVEKEEEEWKKIIGVM
jgi:riboflavin synthase